MTIASEVVLVICFMLVCVAAVKVAPRPLSNPQIILRLSSFLDQASVF